MSAAATPNGDTPTVASKTPDALEEDVILPLSGLPPVSGHLVLAIKANKFVDLADLMPEYLQEL